MNLSLVYSYTRFSDPKQAAGDSRLRQLTYAAKWAANRKLTLDESLSMLDEGLSAYHQHHVRKGALGVFLAAVEAGRVASGSVLIVESLDRLSRAEPLLAQAQLAQIINAGITVVTASDSKEYSRESLKANPMDLVYSLLVMIRAHEESETKSTRVKAAIVRQCQAWQAGTFRGVIRNGADPSWLKWNNDEKRWDVDEDRAAVVRMMLAQYRDGWGSTRIVNDMRAQGLTYAGSAPYRLNLERLVRMPHLIGDRKVTVGDQSFVLQGYYPAIISQAEWDEIQKVAGRRGMRQSRGVIPALFTGFQVSACGYCGGSMVTQNLMNKRRPDGSFPDYARRVGCQRSLLIRKGSGCPAGPNVSVVPLEKAFMDYCSDMLNLQALQGVDRSAAPKARLAGALASLASIEQAEKRITATLLASDSPPAIFIEKARELEAEKAAAQEAVRDAERQVASSARVDIAGADKKWRDLAQGVRDMDEGARKKARQLVADTFECIYVWLRGIRPDETPEGAVDMLLKAKGGASRLLRISKDGSWVATEEMLEAA